jgi:hypothetical protein
VSKPFATALKKRIQVCAPAKIFKSLIFNFARDVSPEWRSLKPTPCNPKIPEALLVVDKKSGTELSMSQVTLDQFN